MAAGDVLRFPEPVAGSPPPALQVLRTEGTESFGSECRCPLN